VKELYHYGVKNQKHGVRRYQYEDGTWTEEGKRRRRTGLNERYGYSFGKEQHGGVLAKLFKPKYSDTFVDTAKNARIAKQTGLKLKKKQGSISDDTKNANPKFDPKDEKWQNNCAKASTAYVMRRNGFDVEAKDCSERGNAGYSSREIEDIFPGYLDRWHASFSPLLDNAKNRKKVNIKTSDDLISVLSSYDSNSFKNVIKSTIKDDHAIGFATIVIPSVGSGHVFCWEKHGKEVFFVDAQDGDTAGTEDFINRGIFVPTGFARVDDLNINTNEIGAIVKNVR
jgi:hypothetical protein